MAERIQRKLAAIVAADVAEYSRLVREDEEATLRALQFHRQDFIDPLIAQFGGRIANTAGDSLLLEFPSAVEAVRCALAFHAGMAERNSGIDPERQINFRIGINVGDVVAVDGDLLGDGVNVAARLEALAEPRGICLSRSARDQVRDTLDLQLDDMGEVEVKNIDRTVRTFKVVLDDKAAPVTTVTRHPVKPGHRKRSLSIAAIVVFLLVVGGAFWWQPWSPRVETASVDRMAFPLPDKPSIAVLPFDNLSGDPDQEYLSDGITENIIVTLSKIPEIFVISGNSTFTYKVKPVKVQQVAEELGVRYVLEGSVQRSNEKVRITAQLIDAVTGGYLWGDRYDRDLQELFALQDEITRQIVTSLQVELTEGEQARVWRRETDNAEAYEYYLRGVERWRQFSEADNAEAQRLLAKAVELDPDFVAAWVDLARTHYFAARHGWSEARDRSVARATELAEKALTMDASRAETYAMLTNVALLKGRHDEAIAYCDKALARTPNSQVIAMCARNLVYVNRSQEALELINRAMRLSPYYPGWYLYVLGDAYRLMGDYDQAISAFDGWRDRNPNSIRPFIFLAYALGMAGREEEARAAVAEILKRDPNYSLKRLAKSLLYKDPRETERQLATLGKAGLPEG